MRWLLVVLTSLAYLATYSASEAEHKEITGTSTKKKDGSRKDKRGFGFGYGGFGYGGGMSYLAYSPIGHNLVYSVGYPVMAHGIALAPLDIGTLAIGSPLVAHAHAPIGGTASPEVSAQAIRTIPAPQLGPGIQGNRLGPATFGVQSGSNRPFSSKIASGTANIGRGVGNTITSGQVVPFGGQNGFLRPQGRPISQGGPTSMNVPPGQAGGNQGGFGGGQSGTGGGQTGFGGGQAGFGGGQAGFGGGPLGLDGVQGAFGGGQGGLVQGGYGGGQFLLDGVQGAFISGPGGYAGGQGQQGGFGGGQSAPPGGQGGPFGSQGAIGFQGGNQAAFPGNQLGGVISNLGNLDLVGGQENYAPPLQGYGNGIQSRTGSPTGGSAIGLGG